MESRRVLWFFRIASPPEDAGAVQKSLFKCESCTGEVDEDIEGEAKCQLEGRIASGMGNSYTYII